jgi:menaquinone-dependent protoporphyrinogen oxidase
LTVDVRPAAEIDAVDPYGAVVIGSGVYMNRWKGEAIEFLKRFERQLTSRPTWLFSSGPTGGTPEADAKVAEILVAQPPAPPEARKRAQRIGARGHMTFGGRVGPGMGGIFERWVPKGDWRDFEAIARWARTVARDLRVEAARA